jgi:hypothetical protein
VIFTYGSKRSTFVPISCPTRLDMPDDFAEEELDLDVGNALGVDPSEEA